MIWHPFTAQSEQPEPLQIVRGNAEYLYDADGKEYIDAVSSWWTVVHGHNHPAIVQAVREQIARLDHVMLAGFTHDSAERLAAKLLALAGEPFYKVFYSDNGSTAVEVMLKLAVQFWHNRGQHKKKDFVRFDASYHGDTVGAMSLAGDSIFNRAFSPLLFEAKCFRYACRTSLDELETHLRKHHQKIAGVVLEPLVAAAGGMVFQSVDELQYIASLCKKYDVLLLLDEVFTGLGRTGSYFALQKANVECDMVAVAKGLTGGMLPLAATLTSARIHAAFRSEDPRKTFYHGHTMTGNPPGCAAALASLGLLDLAKVQSLEQKLQHGWRLIAERFASKLSGVRCLGAVGAANLVSRSEKSGYVFSAASEIRQKALAEGVILRPLGNVIYVTPPYNISDRALEKIFSVVERILHEYKV